MRNIWKKSLSAILAFVMILSMVPGTVFAQETNNGGITIINTDSDTDNGTQSTQKTETVANSVAKIGDTEYATLQAAIAAATAGQTITFLADITADVSITKDLTIDGANFKYTGNISVNGSTVDVIVKNVHFVNGTGYAITTNSTKSITVEDCTVTNYAYGFLYANKATPTVVVKNVTVTDCNYGLHYVYGSKATLENVKMTNVTYGLYIQNYAAKTIALKNCEIDATYPISIWERSGCSGVQTFQFEGENTLIADGEWPHSDYAKLVFDGENAVLNAPAGLTVTGNGTYIALKDYVAQIGEQKFASLTEAINAATAGQTITFLTDITENVTVKKDLTIDGNGKNYTGNISVNGSTVDVIIKNVNFDGKGYDGYAITTNSTKSITVENCTVINYGFGFLYANKSTPTVVVKDVTVTGGNYGLHYVYGSTATLENVTMTNVTNGLYIQNYAAKTITVKNSTISAIAIWERSGYSAVQTFKFEGENTVGTLSDSQYAKYELTEGATLTAPAGATVTTNVEGMKVAYENGVYKLTPKVYVAQIGDVKYESIQDAIDAAQDDDTIVIIADHELNESSLKNDPVFGYEILLLVGGKSITIDFAGHVVTVKHGDAEKYPEGFASCLEAVVFVTADAGLTLTDSTGANGGFYAPADENVSIYSMVYNCGGTFTIEDGVYTIVKGHAAASIIYAEDDHKTTVNGGIFTMGNAGENANTKPWIFNTENKNETFVTVTGGIFNQNPYMNYGTQKDCEATIASDKVFVQINEGEYAGYWKLADAVAVNVEKNLGYATLTEALNAAKSGETVVLLVSDLSETILMVPANVTLDLNGQTIAVQYAVIAFGHIIDTAEVTGGIKVSTDVQTSRTSLLPNNKYLPIYDTVTGCYKFYEYRIEFISKAGKNNTYMQFGIRLHFTNIEAYSVIANSEDVAFDLVMTLTWTGKTGADVIWTVTQQSLKTYAAKAADQMKKMGTITTAIALSITGLDKLETSTTLSAYVDVVSDTNVTGRSNTATYEHVVNTESGTESDTEPQT